MDKAKDAAMKAWPKRKDGRLKDYVCTDDDVRKLYAQGYRKAEKDFALTWEDVAILITIYEAGIENGDYRRYNDAYWMKKYSQDILRRFNEQRKK